MSDKPEREEYLMHEEDLLKGLLEAVESREQETKTIEIARKGKVLFRFRIRPLTEREYNECREKTTRYERSKRFGGLKLPEETDIARYRSMLIYTATVDADRKRLWDNKAAWERLNVLSGVDLIDVVLLPGEKEAIVDKIDEISGYGEDLREQAKN